MKGILKALLLILLPLLVLSQKYDTVNIKKNIASLQNSDFPDTIVKKWSSVLITKEMDTLTQDFRYRYVSNVGVIIEETNSVNGRANGISITYHTNGNIFSMIYFFDSKPWEAIYLADSSGHKHFPGTLSNGSGTEARMDVAGNDLGFITYKNGNPDGDLSEIHGDLIIKGKLYYAKELLQYDTLNVIKILSNAKDTLVAVGFNNKFEDSLSNSIYSKVKNLQIHPISIANTLWERTGRTENYFGIYLPNGVIQIGRWQRLDRETMKPNLVVDYDENGNIKTLTQFDPNGNIFNTIKKP